MGFFKTPKQMLSTFTRGISTIWEKALKPILTFDIREHTEEKVITGTVPIAGVGAGALKMAGVTKKIFGISGKVAKPVVKAVIPKTLKGKIFAGTATIIGAGILKESPTAREFVKTKIKEAPKIPEKVFGYGKEVGKVIEKEKTFGKEDVLKGLKTAGIAGAIVGAGALIIPKIVPGVKVAKKVIEKIKKKKIDEPDLIISEEPEKQLVAEKPLGIEGETPILPETTTIATGKKPYKRRRAKKTPSVRQSVRVNVINKSTSTGIRVTNKRYINQELLN